MTSQDIATLVNVLGFLAGTILYAMLFAMVARTTFASRSGVRPTPDRLPLVSAVLGLLWNLGALVTLARVDFASTATRAPLIALSLTALGFLPAVVVHTTLQAKERGRRATGAGWIIAAAYCLSVAAAVLQVLTLVGLGPTWSELGLRLLTLGFVALMLVLILVTRKQTGWQRATWMAALSVFAVSAFHLSRHTGHESWGVELLGHHASLPLAVAILYQDYRFALADLFLKRALTFVALLAAAVGLFALVGERLVAYRQADGSLGAPQTGALVALWVGTALVYPSLRSLVHRFVDSIILRRADYAVVRDTIESEISAIESSSLVLDAACRALAEALTAHHVGWSASGAASDALLTVTVPTTEAPHFELEIGPLAGGRRLLSDDIALLDWVSVLVARRIDAIRVAHERCERNLREQEMGKLATEAELRALQAQLNPHFLFNALTTIGFLIQTSPERAVDTLMRLTSLLRAVLRRSTLEFSTLGEELDLVEDYLGIERARFEERLRSRIDVAPDLRAERVPPLVIQPLVENAIKHAIRRSTRGGELAIDVRRSVDVASGTSELRVRVSDSGADESTAEDLDPRDGSGVGLSNIEARLARYYDGRATLHVRPSDLGGTTVEVRIPLAQSANGVARVGAES